MYAITTCHNLSAIGAADRHQGAASARFVLAHADLLEFTHTSALTGVARTTGDVNTPINLNGITVCKGSAKLLSAETCASTEPFFKSPLASTCCLPPEVQKGKRHTKAFNLYSLACVAYVLLVGQLPFSAGTTGNFASGSALFGTGLCC